MEETKAFKAKYKERSPLETVEIIKKCFTDLSADFEIKLEVKMGEDIGLFSNQIRLYYKGELMMLANGKGMSEEFALASAYAELYERFANNTGFNHEYIRDFAEYPKLGPDEITRPYLYSESKEEARKLLNLLSIYSDDHRSVPFKEIGGEGEIRLDPRDCYTVYGTNGFAAGNTLVEALNQGLSELCERYVLMQAYSGKISLDRLPLDVVMDEAPEVYDRVEFLIGKGLEVRFYDASYVTGLPVVMSLVIDKANFNHAVKFGSFPVLGIALERCLTETYQGRKISDIREFNTIEPFKGATIKGFLAAYQDAGELFPDTMYADNVLVGKNTDVYLEKDCSNESIYYRFCKLLEKTGHTAYYYDHSIIPEMAAVQIYSKTLHTDYFEEMNKISDECLTEAKAFVSRIMNEDYTRSDLLKYASGDYFTEENSYRAVSFMLRGTKFHADLFSYVSSIAQFYNYEYEAAYDSMQKSLFNDDFTVFPNERIGRYMAFLKYKIYYGEDDSVIRDKLSFWGYSHEELAPLFENDKEFLHKYLFEELVGTEYQMWKKYNKEIAELIKEVVYK